MNEVCLVFYCRGMETPVVAAVTGSLEAAKDWADYNRKVRGCDPIVWRDTGNWNREVGETANDSNDVFYYTIELWPVQ